MNDIKIPDINSIREIAKVNLEIRMIKHDTKYQKQARKFLKRCVSTISLAARKGYGSCKIEFFDWQLYNDYGEKIKTRLEEHGYEVTLHQLRGSSWINISWQVNESGEK